MRTQTISALAAAATLAAGLTTFTAGTASADPSGTSSVAQLKVLEPGDASYRFYHGAIWLEIDKTATNYRWGGLQCKGRELSESSVQLLFASFRSEYQVTLEYVNNDFKDKTYRCITGFSVSKS